MAWNVVKRMLYDGILETGDLSAPRSLFFVQFRSRDRGQTKGFA